MMTTAELLNRLRKEIIIAGSQKAWADSYGVSAGYLNDIIRGSKDPGKKVLDAMGVERVVRFKLKDGA